MSRFLGPFTCCAHQVADLVGKNISGEFRKVFLPVDVQLSEQLLEPFPGFDIPFERDFAAEQNTDRVLTQADLGKGQQRTAQVVSGVPWY